MRAFPSADGERLALATWIALHGPLWPPAALAVALSLCARASRLTDRDLQRSFASLHCASIRRAPGGGWEWTPTVGQVQTGGAVHDRDVLTRVGAVLFWCLTGQPLSDAFADESALRTKLRALRPDLPPQAADLTIAALTAGRTTHLTLAAFARDLRLALGLEGRSDASPPRTRRAAGAAAGAVIALVGVLWSTGAGRQREPAASHGLTSEETLNVDIVTETAQTFAFIEEHTAALQLFQTISQLWLTHTEPGDPRLVWNQAHEAWVRSMARDRLTEYQFLAAVAPALTRALGEQHPYARAARLELADVLLVREETTQARALIEETATATRALLGERADDVLATVPSAPSVRAHLHPIPPEREGFRRTDDGGFELPLTSLQRLLAGRDGWRLHIVATGPCRTSLAVGTFARRISLTTTRHRDGRWQIDVAGTKRPASFVGGREDRVAVSLVANGSDTLMMRLDRESIDLGLDPVAIPPDPPYTLAFTESGHPGACALVWLEIPFPPAHAPSSAP